MPTRRQFLGAAAGPLVLAGCGELFSSDSSRPQPPFRVLYSNDLTNTLACTSPYHKRGEPFSPTLLENTVDEVTGRGVEVHLLQPGLGWIPWWKSQVYPAAEHYRWYQERTGAKPDSFGQYMLAGGDMVQVFLDRCRKDGQTPFISLRMNDAHHLEDIDAKSAKAIWCSRFYVEHPQYRLGPDLAKWEKRVLNWTFPEVRAHKLAFIRELCENYDFAGFEMDFMRFYCLFPEGAPSVPQRREIMTGFVRQVREVLDRTARGGQRRWLCARVPCYLPGLDALGLDPPALVAAGLDMVNVSASYFTLQQSDLAAICRAVPSAAVYLEMCHSIWNGHKPPGVKGYDTFLFRRTTAEQYYTTAHLAYARGAAGVSLFNFVYYREHGGPGRGPFCEPPFEVLSRLGDRAWLARQPQHYFLSSGWGNPYVKAVLPRILTPGKTAAFALDLAPPAGGWQKGGRLRMQTEESLVDSQWTATLDGHKLTPTDDVSEPYPDPYPSLLGRPEQMRAWSVPATWLRDGECRVEFQVKSGTTARLEFLDLAVS